MPGQRWPNHSCMIYPALGIDTDVAVMKMAKWMALQKRKKAAVSARALAKAEAERIKHEFTHGKHVCTVVKEVPELSQGIFSYYDQQNLPLGFQPPPPPKRKKPRNLQREASALSALHPMKPLDKQVNDT